MKEDKLMPVHPGEVLLEEFLKPMDLSENDISINWPLKLLLVEWKKLSSKIYKS